MSTAHSAHFDIFDTWVSRAAPTHTFLTSTNSFFIFGSSVSHSVYMFRPANTSNYTVLFRLWLWLISDSYQDFSTTQLCCIKAFLSADYLCTQLSEGSRYVFHLSNLSGARCKSAITTPDPLVILIKSCTTSTRNKRLCSCVHQPGWLILVCYAACTFMR